MRIKGGGLWPGFHPHCTVSDCPWNSFYFIAIIKIQATKICIILYIFFLLQFLMSQWL